jgi:hypothetical protein
LAFAVELLLFQRYLAIAAFVRLTGLDAEFKIFFNPVICEAGDRCYDFKNILTENFGKIIAVFCSKLLLIFQKLDHKIGLRKTSFSPEN